MSDFRQSDLARPDPARRRPRFGLVAILVTLALLVGVALMIYAMRNSASWFTQAAAPAQPQPTIDYVPPQPATTAARAAIDPATLLTRETALAAQLAALEARTASVSVDAAAASGQAARAEAILIAFAARRAVDRGVGLGYLEEQLRVRFGAAQPRATLTIVNSARQPVTLEELRQGLDANAGDLVAGGDGDFLSSLGRELRTLVVVHKAGTPSPRPADRLARAQRMLDTGQVAAALAEVRRLPGAAQTGAWLAAAGRYVETRRALDVIENAAILGQAAAAPVAVPAVGPAPPVPVGG